MTRLETLEREEQELYYRLDNLEGCEDENEVYAQEIKDIRERLAEVMCEIASIEDKEERKYGMAV